MDVTALRRRFLGADGSDSSRTPSPAPPIRTPAAEAAPSESPFSIHKAKGSDDGNENDSDGLVSVPAKKLERLNSYVLEKKPTKGTKRRNAWIFGLGGLFGVVVAVLFASNPNAIDFSPLKEMHLESLLDVLPAGLIKDAQELQKAERAAIDYDSFAVGLNARAHGVEAFHPVIMIPGVISTGLESWGTEPDSRHYFRKRLWGSWSMMRALVLDKPSWKKHIMLDKYTGLDPPGVKLRAAQGFDAADFFITGYWIWNKILENLASIGYDPSNSFTAAYDWRLSYSNLEVRDQYFSRLKTHIESSRQLRGRKVALLSHSMGSQVLYYFFHWVEHEDHGNGGPNWVEENVDSWINISGCMLGATKGIPAVLSGEMKDTAQLNAFAVYGLEKFLSRGERADLFRAMPGISSMLPIGGTAVWGDQNGAPDDRPDQNRTFGDFMTFRGKVEDLHSMNMTVSDALKYLLNTSEAWYKSQVLSNYSHGIAHSREEVEKNQNIPLKWINPLETRLPLAPSLKVYCFYGVGKPTERAYMFRDDKDPLTTVNVTIDTTYTNGLVDRGVVMGEGDGTVNLLSTGYMCTKGWKMKRYNPAGVKIVTHEMKHEPDRFNPRGGPNTGDHVDILGRSGLNDLILKVVGGKSELVDECITSNIREYADKVKINDDEEG